MAELVREKDWTQARLAVRFKTFQPASVEYGGARRRAHILDLSARGARLHCAEPMPVGSSLALMCSDFTLHARIVWAKEQRFGLEFQSPLPDAHVRRIMDWSADAQ